MAGVGGRNAGFAWFVGVVSAAIVVTLLVLAVPMFPAASRWISEAAGVPQPTASAAATSATVGCRDLYNEAAWAGLRWTEGAEMVASTDAPVSTASDLVAALEPQVLVTCTWTSGRGEISTTVATVPPDAGAIATAALPPLGFECAPEGDRVRCSRTEGDLLETIEAGGGQWVSTSQQAWHPTQYADGVAAAYWSRAG